MDKLQALNDFWNRFGIPAFDSTSVPKEINGVPVKPPYITYDVAYDGFGSEVFLNASIWYREKSWKNATDKEAQISEEIGRGGTMVPYDGGAFWLKKGSPWAQRMNEPDDDMIKRILLQYSIEFLD